MTSWIATGVLVGLLIAIRAAAGAGTPRVCAGTGEIALYSYGSELRVTVTDPAGKSITWARDSTAGAIPGCRVDEATGSDDLTDTSGVAGLNQALYFRFERILEGRYAIRVVAREEESVRLWVDRNSTSHKRASELEELELEKGAEANWTLDWGCRARSDSVWCKLTRVGGTRKSKSP